MRTTGLCVRVEWALMAVEGAPDFLEMSFCNMKFVVMGLELALAIGGAAASSVGSESMVSLSNCGATCQVTTDGGIVTSYVPAGGSEVLALGKRGGIPICWPWFTNDVPAGGDLFGLLHALRWRFVGRREDSRVQIETESTPETLKLWPYKFHAVITVELGDRLTVMFSVENTGEKCFSCRGGFHSFFKVQDPFACRVVGTDGRFYFYGEEVDYGFSRKWSGDFRVCSMTRGYVFDGDSHDYELIDPRLGRVVEISYVGNKKAVVWNGLSHPAFADVGREFVCVEGANLSNDDACVLNPGERLSWSMTCSARTISNDAKQAVSWVDPKTNMVQMSVGADVVSPSLRIITEIETSRWQMGRLDDDTPHWHVIAFPEVKFLNKYAMGMMYYTDTRLSNRRDPTLRRAFYENDIFPYVRWSFEFSDGWSLSTQPQMGFSYIDAWRGTARGNPTFYGDFRWTEKLATPYLTTYVYFRRIYEPGNRMNGHVGLFRKFKSTWCGIDVIPSFLLFFGNAEENATRFGLDPSWNGINCHNAGFSSIMPGVVVSKDVSRYFSVYVSFSELVVVNPKCRETLACRDRPVNHLQMPIFACGMEMKF